MSDALTFDDLAVPLRALRLLAANFGHLPAPTVHVSPIYPDRLELSLYSDFPGFEAWRKALGVSPEDVSYHVQRDGRTGVLRVTAAYGGAELKLVGFGDVCTPVPMGGAA